MPRKKITDAVEILHRRHIRSDPRRVALESLRFHGEIARMLRGLRMKAGLSQRSVTCKTESTRELSYRGSSPRGPWISSGPIW